MILGSPVVAGYSLPIVVGSFIVPSVGAKTLGARQTQGEERTARVSAED